MQNVLSGSEIQPSDLVGTMNFMKDGGIKLSFSEVDSSISSGDVSSLILTTEFFMYALNRSDWMSEFLDDVDQKIKQKETLQKRNSFSVIEGGLSDKGTPS